MNNGNFLDLLMLFQKVCQSNNGKIRNLTFGFPEFPPGPKIKTTHLK